jgi:hypothetical protein
VNKLLDAAGHTVSIVGIVLCLVAGISRLAGSHHVASYETLTLMIGGIALMVLGCLAKLQRLASSSR